MDDIHSRIVIVLLGASLAYRHLKLKVNFTDGWHSLYSHLPVLVGSLLIVALDRLAEPPRTIPCFRMSVVGVFMAIPPLATKRFSRWRCYVLCEADWALAAGIALGCTARFWPWLKVLFWPPLGPPLMMELFFS